LERGHRTSHYIITGGKFAEVFAALAKTGWRLDLESAQHAGKRGGPDSKTPFTCPKCGARVWGKPNTLVACIACEAPNAAPMVPADAAVKPSVLAGVAVQTGQPT
jgi:hypothetical protein